MILRGLNWVKHRIPPSIYSTRLSNDSAFFFSSFSSLTVYHLTKIEITKGLCSEECKKLKKNLATDLPNFLTRNTCLFSSKISMGEFVSFIDPVLVGSLMFSTLTQNFLNA